jgi:FkbM family methyltransferase
MYPKTAKISNYSLTYFNKKELSILKEEIFSKEIYSIDLDSPTPVIFDIGAYIGLSTVYFKHKYPHSKIFCFEPNPNVFPLLEENIYGNQLTDITLHNIALGKSEGIRDFYIDSSGEGAFSTSSFIKNAWNGKQKTSRIAVPVKKLSSFISENIDLVKIDVEGCELEILNDLEESNKIDSIKNIILEYHPISKRNIENVIKILERNNFELSYYLEGEKVQSPTEELLLIVAKKRGK